MKRKTNKVKRTRLVILKFITVSPVSVLTYPVRSAILHTRLTSWARATGSNPPVLKLCWEKLTCRGMLWYELCVKFSFLSDACPACVSFYRGDMNFERPKRPPFEPSLRWFSQNMWCTWSTIRVHQVTTFPTPTPHQNTRSEGKERKCILYACWGCCLWP